MAKKRSKNSARRKRDFGIITNRPNPPSRRLLSRPRLSVLTPIEDFRVNSFPLTRARAYKLLDATPATPGRVASLPKLSWHMPRVVDRLTPQAIVCLRRQVRKEVVFASGSAGRRGRKNSYRRNETSNIHCRRK